VKQAPIHGREERHRLAYLGRRSTGLPRLRLFSGPRHPRLRLQGLIDCNWLQALEVGIDPAHASYLHRFYEDETRRRLRKQFRGASSFDIPSDPPAARTHAPAARRRRHRLWAAPVRVAQAQRQAHACRGDQSRLPYAFVIPMSEMTITHARADRRHLLLLVRIFTSFGKPVGSPEMPSDR